MGDHDICEKKTDDDEVSLVKKNTKKYEFMTCLKIKFWGMTIWFRTLLSLKKQIIMPLNEQ